jgi:membrane protein
MAVDASQRRGVGRVAERDPADRQPRVGFGDEDAALNSTGHRGSAAGEVSPFEAHTVRLGSVATGHWLLMTGQQRRGGVDDDVAGKDGAAVPEDARKPESPGDLTGRSWSYGFKQAWAEFRRDECTDLAAGLTYYAVLSLFPALLAVISLLGVFGQGASTTDTVLELIDRIGQQDAVDQLREPITQMTETNAAGFALVLGVLGALWSASGYVGAFGRAMNRIYEVDEGRPFWKLRPLNLAITVVAVVLAALVLLGLVVTGPFAEELGETLGLGATTITVWNVLKWPIMLLVVVFLVAVLYYATPNVQQPKFRWISVGAGLAIVVWIIASAAFGVYVANFGSYNKTYGSLAGVIILLLWLWLTNLALLFGAEVDAELERSRQLQAGIEAEETLQLPPKDTRRSDKETAKLEAQIEEGRDLREHANTGNDEVPTDRPR